MGEILELTSNEDKVYQIVTNKGDGLGFKSENLTLAELKEKHTITGLNFNSRTRAELQGQPKIDGFLGPMYNGTTGDGKVVIRYESQRVYNALSV